VSSIASYWSSAGGGTVPLAALLALPFDGTLLWVMICFPGAISNRGEAFCGRLWVDGMEILSMD